MSNLYYGLHIDDLPILLGLKSYENNVNKTIKKYLPGIGPEEEPRIKKDISQCYLRYKISPTEYFLFDFRHLSPNERKEYLSDKFIYMTMGKVVGRKWHDEQLENKYGFYQIAKAFFKRNVILVTSKTNQKQFEEFAINAQDIILKPNTSACGNGIKVAQIHSLEEAKAIFGEIIKLGGEWIVEEFIHQSETMAKWNPSSVNTIRISSFLSHKGFFVLCPFFRTGRKGAIVDNGGQGGLYAAIDAETGLVVTDAKDELCNVYKQHPDSHIIYKGWQIPQWNELVSLTKEVHKLFPKQRYIGWDFAHTEEGWVLIEGNWGEFIAQQSTMERGYKKDFLNCLG